MPLSSRDPTDPKDVVDLAACEFELEEKIDDGAGVDPLFRRDEAFSRTLYILELNPSPLDGVADVPPMG